MTFAPGWRWMLTSSAGVRFIHADSRVFSAAISTRGDVGEQHRRAVAVGDDRIEIVAGIADLVVGVDGERLRRAVEIALRRIDVEVGDGRAQIVEIEAVGGERERIGVDAHRRPLTAGNRHQADAGKLRELGREPALDDVLDVGELERIRGDAEGEDRRVGRVDLGVDRRRRKVGGQQVAGGVDRRLHFLLGDVEG